MPLHCLQWATWITPPNLEIESSIPRQSNVCSNRLRFPAPPRGPIVGPPDSSTHRLVWRRLSAIAALDKEEEKNQAFSVQEIGRDKDDDQNTEARTVAGLQLNQLGFYEKASHDDGVNIAPGLKIPGPYNEFESSPGFFRGFCSWCGSTLICRTCKP